MAAAYADGTMQKIAETYGVQAAIIAQQSIRQGRDPFGPLGGKPSGGRMFGFLSLNGKYPMKDVKACSCSSSNFPSSSNR